MSRAFFFAESASPPRRGGRKIAKRFFGWGECCNFRPTRNLLAALEDFDLPSGEVKLKGQRKTRTDRSARVFQIAKSVRLFPMRPGLARVGIVADRNLRDRAEIEVRPGRRSVVVIHD